MRDLRRLVEGRADDESIDTWIIPHSGGGIGATAQVGSEMGGVGADLNILCPEGYDLVVVAQEQQK